MDIPAAGVDRPGVADVGGVLGLAGPGELPIESKPNTVEVNRGRFVTGARRKSAAGFSQAVIEIFQSGGPPRRDGKFSAGTQRPARAHSQHLVLVTGQARAFKETRLRPRESPGRVEKPVVECVTRPAAH